jgi:nucleoside 2-deoxyribosyltransferase
MKVSPWLKYHADVHATFTDALAATTALRPAAVYLCGGINGLSDADCNGWREMARLHLPGVQILDPMDRDYRGREDESLSEIIKGDKRDILHADVVLVNASRPSWGTAMEVLFAWEQNKHVIAFLDFTHLREAGSAGSVPRL